MSRATRRSKPADGPAPLSIGTRATVLKSVNTSTSGTTPTVTRARRPRGPEALISSEAINSATTRTPPEEQSPVHDGRCAKTTLFDQLV